MSLVILPGFIGALITFTLIMGLKIYREPRFKNRYKMILLGGVATGFSSSVYYFGWQGAFSGFDKATPEQVRSVLQYVVIECFTILFLVLPVLLVTSYFLAHLYQPPDRVRVADTVGEI